MDEKMELGGLVTPHCKDQLLQLTLQNIALLNEAEEALQKDLAAFKSGETPNNPVEGRQGIHSYDNGNQRLSASYYGPSMGRASLEIRSNGFHYSLSMPVDWDVDDTLPGITKLSMKTLTAIRDFLQQENLPLIDRESVIIGENPLFWLAALNALCPDQSIDDIKLKTLFTPSKIDGFDDEDMIATFDAHSPAFAKIEINKSQADDSWVKITPLYGYDTIFTSGISPIDRMAAIAKAVDLGAISPRKS